MSPDPNLRRMTEKTFTTTARVLSTKEAAPGIRILTLAPQTPFPFKAGQYARLTFDGFDERPFSIASAPHLETLEFHIKSLGHGASAYAAEKLAVGETIGLRGPFGHAFLRPEPTPILAIGGGLGTAPLKSIIESALNLKCAKTIHLYMGGRQASDLYLENHFMDLSAENLHFHATAVLSEPSGRDHHRTGYVGRVAAGDFTELKGFAVYLAGPPAMVADTVPLLLDKGVLRENIFSDAFDSQ